MVFDAFCAWWCVHGDCRVWACIRSIWLMGIGMHSLDLAGGEESEARQVCGAICANAVCARDKCHSAVERMRAGQHDVLQRL
jgi:hypothetical protein